MSVEQELKEFIFREIMPGEEMTQLDEEDNLIDSGILDSLGMVKMITHLEEEYGIDVEADEMTPENFRSIASIAALISSGKS